MPTRRIVASPHGDCCGIALVRLEGSSFVISVLPKLWRATQAVAIQLDHVSNPQEEVVHVVVSEMSSLLVSSSSIEKLDSFVGALTSLRFSDQDAEEREDDENQETVVSLFEEAALTHKQIPVVTDADLNNSIQQVNDFWAGIDEVDLASLVRAPEWVPNDEPALFGNALFNSIPALERVVRELFVCEAEAALRRRQPDFRTVSSRLPYIRGSLTPSGIRDVMQRKVNDLECSHSELDHDHPWQQAVRLAARAVASRDLRDRVRGTRLSRCRRIDARLNTVSMIPGKALFRERFGERYLGKNRHASYAARLAVAVLRRDSPGGDLASSSRAVAAATGLRVSTPRLFEALLTIGGGESSGIRIAKNYEQISILRGKPPTKRPDLVAVSVSGADRMSTKPRVTAVLDAKYKSRIPNRSGNMDMSDQYQQFAYAAVTSLPTLFVFAAPPTSGVVVSSWEEINIPGHHIKVGVARFPFPGPGSPWSDQLLTNSEPLRDFLRKIC